MDNYSKATDLATESLNSQGAAMQKYSVYEDSYAATAERIQNLWQTIVDNINVEQIYGWLLKIGESLMGIAELLSETGIGRGTMVIAGLSAVMGVFTIKAIAAQKATEGFVAATTLAGKVGDIFKFGLKASPMASIVLITAAVVALVAVLDKLILTNKELEDRLSGTVNEIKNATDQINSMNEELKTANERMQELLGKDTLTVVEKDELEKLKQTNTELQRQIALEEAKKKIKEESAKADAMELYRRSSYTVEGTTSVSGGYTYGSDGTLQMATKTIQNYSTVDKAIVDRTEKLKALKKEMDSLDLSEQKNVSTYEDLKNQYASVEKELTGMVETAQIIASAPIDDSIKEKLNSALDYFSSFGKTALENFTDVFNRADFSEVKEKLTSLAKEQLITGFTLKDSSEYEDFVKVLKNVGLTAGEAAGYINELAKEEEKLNNAPSSGQKTYGEILGEVAENAELAAKAQYEYDTTGALSYETVLSLTKAFGDFTDQLELTADGYKFTTGSVEDLMDAQFKSVDVAYQTAGDAAMAAAKSAGIQAESYDEAVSAIKRLIQAKRDLLKVSLSEVRATGDAKYIAQFHTEIAEMTAILSNYNEAKANYDKLHAAAQQIKSSTYKGLQDKDSKSSSSSSSESAKDEETEYEKFVRITEHKIFLSEQLSSAYEDNEEKYKEYLEEMRKQDELYISLQKATHEEAQRLRASGVSDESEDIEKLSQTWWGYENKRRNMAKQTAERQKTISDDLKEEMINAINELMEAREKEYDKLGEYYDNQISKLDSIISLTELYNDMTNTVSSEMRSINSELEISKASFKYLDENLRKTLFNEDDYNILSNKLNQISQDSSKIYKDYMSEIQNLSEDNMYRIEEITNEFKRQYELKKMEYNIAKNELSLVKAQTELQNVMANRNVRMFTGGEWIWTADYAKVQDAMKGVASAEEDLQQSKVEMEQKKIVQNYEGLQDILNLQKESAERELENMKNMWESIQKGMEKPTRDINNILSDIASNGMPELKNIITTLSSSLSSLISGVTGDFGKDMSGMREQGSIVSYDKYLQNKVDWLDAQKRGDTATMDRLNKENIAYREKWGIGTDDVSSQDAASILARKNIYKTASVSSQSVASRANAVVSPSSQNNTDSHNIYLGENFASKISSFDFSSITSILKRYVPITT